MLKLRSLTQWLVSGGRRYDQHKSSSPEGPLGSQLAIRTCAWQRRSDWFCTASRRRVHGGKVSIRRRSERVWSYEEWEGEIPSSHYLLAWLNRRLGPVVISRWPAGMGRRWDGGWRERRNSEKRVNSSFWMQVGTSPDLVKTPASRGPSLFPALAEYFLAFWTEPSLDHSSTDSATIFLLLGPSKNFILVYLTCCWRWRWRWGRRWRFDSPKADIFNS